MGANPVFLVIALRAKKLTNSFVFICSNLLNYIKGDNPNIDKCDNDSNDSEDEYYVWGQDINEKKTNKDSKSFQGKGHKLN